MYIHCRTWYTAGGQQRDYGPFLMLFQQMWDLGTGDQPRELRALVRSVRLEAFGNFMMGRCKLKLPKEDGLLTITLSGTFGGDGLPISIPRAGDVGELPSRLWPLLPQLPDELVEDFWTNEEGAGHEKIREWVEKHLKELRRLRRPEGLVLLT